MASLRGGGRGDAGLCTETVAGHQGLSHAHSRHHCRCTHSYSHGPRAQGLRSSSSLPQLQVMSQTHTVQPASSAMFRHPRVAHTQLCLPGSLRIVFTDPASEIQPHLGRERPPSSPFELLHPHMAGRWAQRGPQPRTDRRAIATSSYGQTQLNSVVTISEAPTLPTTQSFNKRLLSTFYVPGTVLGSGDTVANQTMICVVES